MEHSPKPQTASYPVSHSVFCVPGCPSLTRNYNLTNLFDLLILVTRYKYKEHTHTGKEQNKYSFKSILSILLKLVVSGRDLHALHVTCLTRTGRELDSSDSYHRRGVTADRYNKCRRIKFDISSADPRNSEESSTAERECLA